MYINKLKGRNVNIVIMLLVYKIIINYKIKDKCLWVYNIVN